ncbi:ATP-binding protein [Streptomyces beihaiensis]|uniref:ATP-binding protein n=1 Tax=Streptomyces beihaiensis TaxID=2984495 RepID=A0ABT3U220_9ACTN|nr:ATP-binding protein [Streptomyces beihaiensis]MCX3062320.1 ATP-binding protein [Streptomyces beihaiensis]
MYHHMRFTVGDHSARHVRRILRIHLLQWEMTELRDAAELAVTELLSNVVRHVPSRQCTLDMFRIENGLRVEVSDPDPRMPKVRKAAELENGGRGLLLVDAVTDRWGLLPSPPGKTVWFEFDAKAACAPPFVTSALPQ